MFKFLVATLFVCVILSNSSLLAQELGNSGVLKDYAKAIEINSDYLNKRANEEIKKCISSKDQTMIEKCVKKFRRVNSNLMKMILEMPEPIKETVK